MTAPPDPAAVAAAGRDLAARLLAEHQASCRAKPDGCPWPCDDDCELGPLHCRNWHQPRHKPDWHDPGECDARSAQGCAACASLAGHAERTARQAELLAPARTGEMF